MEILLEVNKYSQIMKGRQNISTAILVKIGFDLVLHSVEELVSVIEDCVTISFHCVQGQLIRLTAKAFESFSSLRQHQIITY